MTNPKPTPEESAAGHEIQSGTRTRTLHPDSVTIPHTYESARSGSRTRTGSPNGGIDA